MIKTHVKTRHNQFIGKDYTTLVVETPSGNFEITESFDGGMIVEVGGPSSIEIEGGNRHSVWSMTCDKSIIIYRSVNGKAKKLNYEERLQRDKELREEWLQNDDQNKES